MFWTLTVPSPVGPLTLTADETGLTGVAFTRQRYSVPGVGDAIPGETPALVAARRWLTDYFAGTIPDFLPPLHFIGSDFQRAVWRLLLEIPYGETTTYGALAEKIARARGLARVSAQAVGGAVGHNPISIIVPCHRVVGASGSLTGYGGGIQTKVALLTHEGVDMTHFTIPTKGTAL